MPGSAAGTYPSPTSDDDTTVMTDRGLMAARDAPVGGQAVLEGVMMRGVGTWAVAVRAPDASDEDGATEDGEAPLGPIQVSSFELTSALRRHR